MTDFASDTAIEPAGPGQWRATISPDWSVGTGPNGGYIAAIVVRAMQAAVDDSGRQARTVTLHYLRPPATGPADVHVTVERQGRTLTSLSARIVQGGRTVVTALGAFAVDVDGAAAFADPRPDVGPPAALVAPPERPEIPAVAHRVVTAQVFGSGPFSAADEALVGGWLRLAEPTLIDAATLAFYADAWVPAPWARLTAPVGVPTLELTVHFRARVPHAGMAAADPVLARFVSRTAHAGYAEEDGELWAPDGTLLAQSRQLSLLYPAA